MHLWKKKIIIQPISNPSGVPRRGHRCPSGHNSLWGFQIPNHPHHLVFLPKNSSSISNSVLTLALSITPDFLSFNLVLTNNQQSESKGHGVIAMSILLSLLCSTFPPVIGKKSSQDLMPSVIQQGYNSNDHPL